MTWQALLQVGHELVEVNGVHVRDIPRVDLERTGRSPKHAGERRNAQVPGEIPQVSRLLPDWFSSHHKKNASRFLAYFLFNDNENSDGIGGMIYSYLYLFMIWFSKAWKKHQWWYRTNGGWIQQRIGRILMFSCSWYRVLSPTGLRFFPQVSAFRSIILSFNCRKPKS